MKTKTSTAIVGMSGCFPGARNSARFWDSIVSARVAPLSSLQSSWGIERAKYFSNKSGVDDKIYMDLAFRLNEASDVENRAVDRQAKIGNSIVLEALKNVSSGKKEPRPEEIAIVAATSWTDQSYIFADAKMTLDNLGIHVDFELPSVAHSPDAQLEMLVNRDIVAGPRIAVDTACASSLYGIEFARALLEKGRVKRVVVLGLNLNLPLFLYVGLCKVQAMSPVGKILPFAKNASGMVPGECAAAIVLEKLETAKTDGREILGVVKSVGLSSDGADRSIFAPSFKGQSLAYERAYEGIDPSTILYVEAHGTGTPVGDATELSSLNQFFSPRLSLERKIPLGSVKSLIGHTLAAAGLASVIKGLLILKNSTIPPHIEIEEPNSKIEETCLFLPREATRFGEGSSIPRRIGISSFGFGGADAHLVLESFQRPEKSLVSKRQVVSEDRRPFEPIAIVDMECVLGDLGTSEHGCDSVSKRTNFLTRPPADRFGFSNQEDLNDLGIGQFFESSVKIDGHGLRMGPNFIKRHDSLQLLVTDCVHSILHRCGNGIDVNTAGVIVVSNLGGAMSLALSRKYIAKFCDSEHSGYESQISSPALKIPLTIDGVTSGLPTMSSGFPAFHFDLKGFHQTLSGSAGAFWTAIMSAPFWLDERCSSLFIGTARLLKGPVDVKMASTKGKNNALPVGEGVGIYLLKTLSRAKADNDKVYATIEAIIDGNDYRTSDDACLLAGVKAEELVSWETCELKGTVDENRNLSQQKAGFLLEATGVETLAFALSEKKGRKAIEIKDGNRSVAVLFLSVHELYEKEQPKPKMEINTNFFLYGKESTSNSPDVEQENHGDRQLTSPVYSKWLQTSSRGVLAFFEAQKNIAKMFSREIEIDKLNIEPALLEVSHLRRDQKNLVITNCKKYEKDNLITAELVVDESHTYFFDHELDHVPAILLFEGIYQLSQIALEARLPVDDAANKAVGNIETRFIHFADKKAPIYIELTSKPGKNNALIGTYRQNGKIIARARVDLFSLDVIQAEGAGSRKDAVKVLDKGLLHKRRRENVLVSNFRKTSESVFRCDVLPPERKHIFSDGDTNYMSPLYLVEAARQMMMLGAHTVMDVPKGQPMTIVSMAVNLGGVLSRNVPLVLEYGNPVVSKIEEIIISEIEVRVLTCFGVKAKIKIKTQVVDPHTYEQQRWGSA